MTPSTLSTVMGLLLVAVASAFVAQPPRTAIAFVAHHPQQQAFSKTALFMSTPPPAGGGEDDDKAEASDKSSGGSSSAAPITTTTTAAMTPTNSATNFLEDEDYLRVHLPGYMKRYVDLLAVPFHYLLIFKCFVLVLLSNC